MINEQSRRGFVSHLVVEIEVHAAGWIRKKKCLLFSLRIEGEERFVRLVCGHIASSFGAGGVGDEQAGDFDSTHHNPSGRFRDGEKSYLALLESRRMSKTRDTKDRREIALPRVWSRVWGWALWMVKSAA